MLRKDPRIAATYGEKRPGSAVNSAEHPADVRSWRVKRRAHCGGDDNASGRRLTKPLPERRADCITADAAVKCQDDAVNARPPWAEN